MPGRTLVVLVRGLNVGGHRSFRPSRLAARLRRLDVVSIGATGTFVVRKPSSRTGVRAAIARRLPFKAEIAVFDGREIAALLAGRPFARDPARPGVVRFVSVPARRSRTRPRLPVRIPARGRWLVRVHARAGRFVLGQYRRDMQVIGHLGSLDRVFGAPLITRNWNTFVSIGAALDRRDDRGAAGRAASPRGPGE